MISRVEWSFALEEGGVLCLIESLVQSRYSPQELRLLEHMLGSALTSRHHRTEYGHHLGMLVVFAVRR